MKSRRNVLVALGAVIALVAAGTSWRQVSTFGQPPTADPRPVPEPAANSGSFPAPRQPSAITFPAAAQYQVPAGENSFAGYPTGTGHSTAAEIGQLMSELNEADEAKKAELAEKLESAIDKYFDEDMKVREAELSQLEERLARLRNQLERRRKAKDEIIKLQLKVMLNEADGLGFSGASRFGAGNLPRAYGNRFDGAPMMGPAGGGGGFGVPNSRQVRPVPTAPAGKR